jgi:hypothetical protein
MLSLRPIHLLTLSKGTSRTLDQLGLVVHAAPVAGATGEIRAHRDWSAPISMPPFSATPLTKAVRAQHPQQQGQVANQ